MSDRYRSGAYGRQHPGWFEEDAEAKAAGVAELLRFGGIVPSSVVDVGCGSGAVLWHLHQMLGDAWPDTDWEGWDIAPDAIRRARAREARRLGYVCDDFLASEREAELLLCLDVAEHVVDDVGFLASLRSRAQNFVLRLPLDLSVLDVARPTRLTTAGPHLGHRHLYTRELALQRVEEAGYRVVEERYHRARPFGRGITERLRRRGLRVLPHLTARWLGGVSLLVLAES